jgi:hypothetical protein
VQIFTLFSVGEFSDLGKPAVLLELDPLTRASFLLVRFQRTPNSPGLLAIYAQESNSPKPHPTKLIHCVAATQLPTLVNPSSREV